MSVGVCLEICRPLHHSHLSRARLSVLSGDKELTQDVGQSLKTGVGPSPHNTRDPEPDVQPLLINRRLPSLSKRCRRPCAEIVGEAAVRQSKRSGGLEYYSVNYGRRSAPFSPGTSEIKRLKQRTSAKTFLLSPQTLRPTGGAFQALIHIDRPPCQLRSRFKGLDVMGAQEIFDDRKQRGS